jgi:tRNA dimethylallyltransferase
VAERLGGEIVNCDSIQVYRGFDIGAAKVPPESRRGVPHHMLDVIGPGEDLSAGAYARMAREVTRDIHRRERIPIVVGGTGFYLRALLDGLSPAPEGSAELRKRLKKLEQRRPGILHRVLQRYDRGASTRIHPNDTPKLIRAIEITMLSGTPVTEAQAAPRDAFPGIRVLKLGLNPDRQELYSHLNKRTEWMFDNGLIEETENLLRSGYDASSKPMQSVGYRQAVQFLCGNASLDSATEDSKVKTRNYAKRQITWFRNERDVSWTRGFGADSAVQQWAFERVETFFAAT